MTEFHASEFSMFCSCVSLVPFHAVSLAPTQLNPVLVFYSFQLYNPLTTTLLGCLTLFLSSHL